MAKVVPNQLKLHRWTIYFLVKRLTKRIGIKDYAISGSYRRGKWWSNDIDLLIPIKSESESEGIRANLVKEGWYLKPGRVTDEYIFSYQYLKKTNAGILVLDLFLAPQGSWGNALLYTTGPKQFNDKVREHLISTGYSWLNPRYFTHILTNTKHSFETEKAALYYLGLKWVKPSNRI